MSESGRRYKFLLILLAVVFFAGVFFSQRGMNTFRSAERLTRLEPVENLPPTLAFTTVLLGGFRGLIANVLWVRAMQMQDDGKFFEMAQLADWITKLQPHASHVWRVQAWNMSYNISVKFDGIETPDIRWHWVRRGFELIRDQGLVYNPHSIELHHELAWHFQHKIGHNLDDAHGFYKKSWAEEMIGVLGNRRDGYQDLLDPQTDEARVRRELLLTKYKMTPESIQEVDEKWGPLEWRLPDAHAVYWAQQGINEVFKTFDWNGDGVISAEESKAAESETAGGDFLKLRRIIYQSLQQACVQGRMISPPPNLYYGWEVNLVDRANRGYEFQMEEKRREDEADGQDSGLVEHIGTGHKNFLRNAVYFLYVNNRRNEAARWFKILKDRYPKAIVPLDMDLDAYAVSKVQEDVRETDHNQTQLNIMGLLGQSFMFAALGDDEKFVGYKNLATQIWNRFQKEIGMSKNRVGLQPFKTLEQQVLKDLFNPEVTPFNEQMLDQLRSVLGLPANYGVTLPVSQPSDPEAPAPDPEKASSNQPGSGN